jgi:hypothetical protein
VSLHDAYARRTPYELVFPDARVIGDLSVAVAEEAGDRGLDDTDLDPFMRLEAVGGVLQSLRPEDAPPETLLPFIALIYHSLHFFRAGSPMWLVDTATVRRLVGTPSGGGVGATPSPPARAGYLQVPQHMVWIVNGEGDRPESLDGFFWTTSEAGRLHVLSISGVLPDRPGFGASPLPPAPLADATSWLDAPGRPGGDDFRSSLPGADLDELVEVRTAGEVLKILARFFAHVAGEVGPASPVGQVDMAHGMGPGPAPRPSVLPHVRVTSRG